MLGAVVFVFRLSSGKPHGTGDDYSCKKQRAEEFEKAGTFHHR
jgi:hypothetical protein